MQGLPLPPISIFAFANKLMCARLGNLENVLNFSIFGISIYQGKLEQLHVFSRWKFGNWNQTANMLYL